jgi:hypothetical protein
MENNPRRQVKTEIGTFELRVHSAACITLDSDLYNADRNISENCVTINRVAYRLSFTARLDPKTGTFVREHEYMHRKGSYSNDDYTWNALKKAREVCTTFINQ